MWTWILVLLSGWTVAEDGGVRTLLYFESEHCVACRKIRPTIDQLRSEGYSIQAKDAEREEASAAKWRVHQIPTLLFLEDGVEVDRLVGAVPLATIKSKLMSTGHSPNRKSSSTEGGGSVSAPDAFFLGSNHPYLGMATAREASRTRSAPIAEGVNPLIGDNHPYLARPNDSSRQDIASRGGVRTFSTFVNPLLRNLRPLPKFPEAMEATVRIRVDYEETKSIGAGTIIEANAEEAIVLTCGHLFQESREMHEVSVEVFRDGKPARLPATLMSFKTKGADLGVVRFQHQGSASRIPICPMGEAVRELDSVFSIGCDRGESPTRKDGVVTKLNRYVGHDNLEVAGAPIQGRSGGGLFDARGRLIGVCYAADYDRDEGLYVGLREIYAELSRLGLSHLFQEDALSVAN